MLSRGGATTDKLAVHLKATHRDKQPETLACGRTARNETEHLSSSLGVLNLKKKKENNYFHHCFPM